jgi:voltage-gated potassium channel
MGENQTIKVEQNELDKKLAWPMFIGALLFLLITGFLIHATVSDIFSSERYAFGFRAVCYLTLAIVYLMIIAEAVAHLVTGSSQMRQHVFFLLCPFFRLCPRDHIDGSHAWVVGLGWRKTTPRFEGYLSRMFSAPMIIITLFVLPVVACEFFWADKIAEDATWRFVIETATGFIWMAFVFEFALMVTVVEKKLRYCKQNWIDIAVIILPIIWFLRAARLGKLVKLQQLSRTAKIYRMRGLMLRSWRAIVTLDVIDKILRRDPNYRLDKLQSQIDEKEDEIKLLKSELQRLEEKVNEPKQGREAILNNATKLKIEHPKNPMQFSYSKKPSA